jgi:hypothetical protein
MTITITHTAPNGDIYEATKAAPADAWDINYPTGAFRMYGTQGVVMHTMKCIAQKKAEEEKLDD